MRSHGPWAKSSGHGLAYFDWLDLSQVSTDTRVDRLLEGGVTDKLSPCSELCIPTEVCLNGNAVCPLGLH